ncbi:unnamed protein product [Linum trigynum]|uniref:Uncharacterized protein n=1 Tax=Linum trigynum TaxID=586398 RepID=A0AAV2CEQ7_9ROSI
MIPAPAKLVGDDPLRQSSSSHITEPQLPHRSAGMGGGQSRRSQSKEHSDAGGVICRPAADRLARRITKLCCFEGL